LTSKKGAALSARGKKGGAQPPRRGAEGALTRLLKGRREEKEKPALVRGGRKGRKKRKRKEQSIS